MQNVVHFQGGGEGRFVLFVIKSRSWSVDNGNPRHAEVVQSLRERNRCGLVSHGRGRVYRPRKPMPCFAWREIGGRGVGHGAKKNFPLPGNCSGSGSDLLYYPHDVQKCRSIAPMWYKARRLATTYSVAG